MVVYLCLVFFGGWFFAFLSLGRSCSAGGFMMMALLAFDMFGGFELMSALTV